MFGIVLSALNVVLAFIVRSVLVKFVFFFGLYFVTSEFIPVLMGLLPNSGFLSSSFGGIPSSVAYFLNLFMVPQGISMVFSAYVTRFIIRRIPVIG
ncbi:DUF2523 domain-containing protein [Castellaniella ginsengisoli]|uniref:DUF2523 domain-containing protein n=1 Tax=Castellaniella ginsengisoli TaxID=546114 RepID=A0AB39H737_9BURK